MTTCPSCGIAGNNFSCPNHTYWGINPNLDLVPPPQTSVNWINPTSAELFAEIGRLNVRLNEREEEIAVLKQTSADLCPECGWRFLIPDIGCQGCERARLEQEIERLRGERPATVAWLRQTSERMNDATLAHAADCIEDAEHRCEEER